MAGAWQRARIMITVKTYPELSTRYHETSCVASIRLDQGEPQHVRLFPVPFRLLDEKSQFSKYSIVEVDVQRHQEDRRSESLRPNLQTLKVIKLLGTADGWRERFSYVRPLVAPSLCAIKRDQEARAHRSVSSVRRSSSASASRPPNHGLPRRPPWRTSWIFSPKIFGNWSGCRSSSGTGSGVRTSGAAGTTWG